jgi:hypothetical protein
MSQEPKDQKPLSDKELEQATGGAASVESTGGGGSSSTGTESTAQPVTPPMSLEESGMPPDVYYTLFPNAKPQNLQ